MHLLTRSGKRVKKNGKLSEVGGHSDGKELGVFVFAKQLLRTCLIT